MVSIHREKLISRLPFAPITILAGPIPIVITPSVNLVLGIDAEVSGGVASDFSFDGTLRAGVTYRPTAGWGTVGEAGSNIRYSALRLTAGGTLKGYVGPEFDLFLYGAAGGYVRGSYYVEADADLFQVPWWTMRHGIEATAGAKIRVLSRVLADFDAAAVSYSRLVADAAGGLCIPDVEPPTSYRASGLCPFECCLYGVWTVTRDTYLYAQQSTTSPVLHTLRPGERVEAITGEVITKSPGIVRAREIDPSCSRLGIRLGDCVTVLNYVGEGYYTVWKNGAVAGQCQLVPADREPAVEWWVWIRAADGTLGWALEDFLHFAGNSNCA